MKLPRVFGPAQTALIASLIGATALVACGEKNAQTPGQQLDGAIADVKQAGRDAKQDVQTAAARSEASVKQAATSTAETVSEAVTDATITTKIKAALAVDDKLKATSVEVVTTDGRVTLKGTAPDPASLDRASVLAKAVNGVRSVDNRLVLNKRG